MREEDVLAIFSSDWHLQLKAPPARNDESDWLEVLGRVMDELNDLQVRFSCPHIVAGDIFDYWKAEPELINYVLDHMPKVYAIPGQHDLPLHNYQDIKKSAYWTLVKAGKIQHLEPGNTYVIPVKEKELVISSFPWGFPIKRCENIFKNVISIAVIHSYCWKQNCSYPGAKETERIGAYRKGLKGYDAAVFGDNHIGFTVNSGKCSVINTGSLMRLKANQREYKPRIGLLMVDGSIQEYFLDTTRDVFKEVDEDLKQLMTDSELDMEEFVKELEQLGDAGLDFKEAIKEYLETHKVNKQVRETILSALE